MIKTIIILTLLVLFLLVIFYPKKKCGCKSNHSSNSLVKKDNKYVLTHSGSTKSFDSYSEYLKHYYYNAKNEHPLPLIESNIVSKAFPRIVEGFEDKVVSEEVPEEEEIIIAEEEETNLNTIREKVIYTIIVQYLKKNPDCVKGKNGDKFETSFANYMTLSMKKVLSDKKFDEDGGLASLTSIEFEKFLEELRKMPDCKTLFKKYFEIKQDKEPTKKPQAQKESKQKVSTTIKQQADESGKTTTISSNNEGTIPTITTIINTNRGSVNENPHGNRRLNPENAPYLKYFNDIGKKLQELTLKVDSITVGKPAQSTSSKVDNSKYIKQEQQIRNQIDKTKSNAESNVNNAKSEAQEKVDTIKSQKSQLNDQVDMEVKTNINNQVENKVQIKSQVSAEKRLENANQKLYVDAKNTENKMFNDKENAQDIGANFNFKPKVKFNHNEPSKKIMSAYGWSYMPPQTWSVPQKRPPVCIPDDDKQATVKPIYDKGTPVDAMSWTQANNLLPKTEYTEKYNANYYYPGWVVQDKVNYPLNKAGLERSEYYNNNLAKKIE